MKKTPFATMAIAALLICFSCTDAQRAKQGGFGYAYKVEVLSGGQIVRTYTSSGKVLSEKNSDGRAAQSIVTNLS